MAKLKEVDWLRFQLLKSFVAPSSSPFQTLTAQIQNDDYMSSEEVSDVVRESVTSNEGATSRKISTVNRNARRQSTAVKEVVEAANAARQKEIEAELNAAVEEDGETDEDKARMLDLDAKMKEYSAIETKADFEVALLKLNEEILKELAAKKDKEAENKRLTKKLDISALKFQKELIQKQKEIEEGKDVVKKLQHDVQAIKSVTNEEETAVKSLIDGRKILMDKLKTVEDELSRKTQEMLKVQADAEQEILKLKTEKSQAMTKLAGTLTERKKKEKNFEEEKTKLEETVASLTSEIESLKSLEAAKKEESSNLEDLQKKNEDFQAQIKKLVETQEKKNGRIQELEKQVAVSEAKMAELHTDLQKSKEEKQHILKSSESQVNKVSELENSLSKARAEIEDIQQKNAGSTGKIAELNSEISKLKGDKEALKKNMKEQLLAEMKKKDAHSQETKENYEATINSLKREIDGLQKSLLSQKKNTSVQFEEQKKAFEQKITQLQQDLVVSRRDCQDITQKHEEIAALSESNSALIKDLKKKVVKLESEKNHLTANLTESTLSTLQRDIITIKSSMNSDLQHTVELLKTMERENKVLATQVTKYQNVALRPTTESDKIDSGAERNNRLERLISDLERYQGKKVHPAQDVLAIGYEKEIVGLTEELLKLNKVAGQSKSMKVLSNKLHRLNEPETPDLNPHQKLPSTPGKSR